MSWFSDLFDSPKTTQTTENNYKALPDYTEASNARGTWADTLKGWANSPGYGAIQPDWNSIWENASGKVNRFYNGGPEGPGLIAGVKSNLAARGMSENPAAEAQIGKLGMQQGYQLQDIATQEAQSQAALSEQGRTTWLNSIMQLAGLKPSYANYGSTTTGMTSGGEGWDIIGGLGSMGVQAYGANQQNKTLSSLAGGSNNSDGGDISSLLSMFGLGGGGLGAADSSGFGLESLLPFLMAA